MVNFKEELPKLISNDPTPAPFAALNILTGPLSINQGEPERAVGREDEPLVWVMEEMPCKLNVFAGSVKVVPVGLVSVNGEALTVTFHPSLTLLVSETVKSLKLTARDCVVPLTVIVPKLAFEGAVIEREPLGFVVTVIVVPVDSFPVVSTVVSL